MRGKAIQCNAVTLNEMEYDEESLVGVGIGMYVCMYVFQSRVSQMIGLLDLWIAFCSDKRCLRNSGWICDFYSM